MSQGFKLFSIFILVLGVVNSIYGQANLLNARVPQDVGQLNDQQSKEKDETTFYN